MEKKNTSHYSPILLKLSDKVLLNFFILPIFSAGWEAGIRSHIFFLLQKCVCLFVCFNHYDFRRGLAADRLRFGAGKEYQCSVSPAGASSAQMQRAGKQETEPQRLTLLSSTSAANASLTFPQKIQLHFQRGDKSPRGSRSIQTRHRA